MNPALTLSTSNSSQAKARPMFVLFCSAIGVISFAVARPQPTSFVNPSWYWQAKVEWKKCANIVLAGNSRTYRGLSPVEFERILGGKAINAGFSSGTYSEEYCDYLETLFDDDDSTPNILVAGITHGAIRDLDRSNNGFINARNKSKSSFLTAKQQMESEEYIFAFRSLIEIKVTENDNNYIQEFFFNGWVSSDYLVRDEQYALSSYKRAYEQGQLLCNEQELEKVMASLKRLTKQGIDVYCLWLPTSSLMTDLENEMSGMHRDEIESLFKRQGFSWISFPDMDYTSYDGSHLEADSASKLSTNLAHYIKKQLEQQ